MGQGPAPLSLADSIRTPLVWRVAAQAIMMNEGDDYGEKRSDHYVYLFVRVLGDLQAFVDDQRLLIELHPCAIVVPMIVTKITT